MKCSLLAERVKMILGNNDMSMQFVSFLFSLFTTSMPFILKIQYRSYEMKCMHCICMLIFIYLSRCMYRIWVEESYFQPVGQRTPSNQALYQDKNLIVIYSSIRSATIKMINYVKNRAVAVAFNNSTDIKTYFNEECKNKQVVLLYFFNN